CWHNLINIAVVDILLQATHVVARVFVHDIGGDSNRFLFEGLVGGGGVSGGRLSRGGIDKRLRLGELLIQAGLQCILIDVYPVDNNAVVEVIYVQQGLRNHEFIVWVFIVAIGNLRQSLEGVEIVISKAAA